jgi:hypothetical protein
MSEGRRSSPLPAGRLRPGRRRSRRLRSGSRWSLAARRGSKRESLIPVLGPTRARARRRAQYQARRRWSPWSGTTASPRTSTSVVSRGGHRWRRALPVVGLPHGCRLTEARVLVVCTANVCRSPIAVALLERSLSQRDAARVGAVSRALARRCTRKRRLDPGDAVVRRRRIGSPESPPRTRHRG